jgi:drug/metabolite transporter (DMT)-like permease
MAGAVALVLEGASLDDFTAGEHFRGNLLLALHGLLWGLYSPIVKPLLARGHDPLVVSSTTLVMTLLVLVPIAAPELSTIERSPHLVPALGYTLFLAVAGSFGATILWITSLRYLPASTTVPFVFVQPLTGIALGALLLGETMSLAAVLGAALIAAGVAVAILVDR